MRLTRLLIGQEYIRRQLEEEQRQLEILQQQLLQEQALLLVTHSSSPPGTERKAEDTSVIKNGRPRAVNLFKNKKNPSENKCFVLFWCVNLPGDVTAALTACTPAPPV